MCDETSQGPASANRDEDMGRRERTVEPNPTAVKALAELDDCGHDIPGWLRREVGKVTAHNGKLKKALVASRDEAAGLRAELDSAHKIVETTQRNYQALEDRFREVYVELQFMKSKEADAADSQPAGVALG